MLWLSLLLFIVVLFLFRDTKSKKLDAFFNIDDVEKESFNAVNLKSLVEKKNWQKFGEAISPTLNVLGPRFSLFIGLYMVCCAFMSWYLVVNLLMIRNILFVIGLWCVLILFGYSYLAKKRRREFENTFPDALNILMSAVTAGESLMHAISYVGEVMDNSIGREFKQMGDRLKLGETTESVLQRACKNYPYPEFLFFTLTIKANSDRGGQLKGVLARLIRVLVDARGLEKKAMSMTSEARISAKIVAAIPLLFTVLINYVAPSNVDFLLNDPSGRMVLFYVVGSEVLGLLSIWLLIRGVRR
ncbi:type II secretion system F family protein [Vibrio caribbeanicus]|uniref:type II secretion system F family protein n=1 Tax=Vibrio caribbeanicus TaxID=701175 RepID=UPI0030DD8B12